MKTIKLIHEKQKLFKLINEIDQQKINICNKFLQNSVKEMLLTQSKHLMINNL